MKTITISVRHRNPDTDTDPLDAMDYPVEICIRYETDDGKEYGEKLSLPKSDKIHVSDDVAMVVSSLIQDAYTLEADWLE